MTATGIPAEAILFFFMFAAFQNIWIETIRESCTPYRIVQHSQSKPLDQLTVFRSTSAQLWFVHERSGQIQSLTQAYIQIHQEEGG